MASSLQRRGSGKRRGSRAAHTLTPRRQLPGFTRRPATMIFLKASRAIPIPENLCAQPSGLDPNRARVGADEVRGFRIHQAWTGTWTCLGPGPLRKPAVALSPFGSGAALRARSDAHPSPIPSRAAPHPPPCPPLFVRYHLAISHLPLTAARNRPPAHIGARRVLAIDAAFIDLHFACAADTRPVCAPHRGLT